jgi:class 3 adenylate cyclase
MRRQETQLAILFADISGSTRLFATVGDALARTIERDWLAQLDKVLQQYDGTLVKTVGDGVMCSFANADQAVMAASGMQVAVESHPPYGYPISLHVGLHHGAVICEFGDVFGTTVNIAAYLSSIAAPGQIIMTDATQARLSDALKLLARPVFRAVLKGHSTDTTLYEVLWRTDRADQTESFFATRALRLAASDDGGLTLSLGDQQVCVNYQHPVVTLGRHASCDLVLADPGVSHRHARVELQGTSFFLIDQSINGSFVILDDQPEIMVLHRDLVLDGAGRLSPGRSFGENPQSVITFSHDRRSAFRI